MIRACLWSTMEIRMQYENSNTNYKGKGIDQLQEIIDGLKLSKETGETSRRLIMSA